MDSYQQQAERAVAEVKAGTEKGKLIEGILVKLLTLDFADIEACNCVEVSDE